MITKFIQIYVCQNYRNRWSSDKAIVSGKNETKMFLQYKTREFLVNMVYRLLHKFAAKLPKQFHLTRIMAHTLPCVTWNAHVGRFTIKLSQKL